MHQAVDQAREQELGNLIRVYRTLKGKNLIEIANVLGVSPQQMQKYEKGINRISALNLKAIADDLELPITAFLGKEGFSENIDTERVTEQDCILLKSFRAINNAYLKECLLNLMQELALIKRS